MAQQMTVMLVVEDVLIIWKFWGPTQQDCGLNKMCLTCAQGAGRSCLVLGSETRYLVTGSGIWSLACA